jgi:anti-sigma factor RsiW
MAHPEDARALHRRAWEAIPWLVNGRIDEAERGALEAHLAGCRDCRDELALQQRLRHELARDSAPAAGADAGLAKLWQRIDAQAAMQPAAPARAWVRWLAAAAVLEGVALAALIGAAVGTPEPQYRTFSAPPAAVAPHAIRAVFAADLPLGELQALLERADLQIVAGPSDVGVYTLAPRPDARQQGAALERLRADARVRFAEPAAGSTPP